MFLLSICSQKVPEDKLLKCIVQLLLREASLFPILNRSCQAQKRKWIQRIKPYSGNPAWVRAQGRTRQEWFLMRLALNLHSSNRTERSFKYQSKRGAVRSIFLPWLLPWSRSMLSPAQIRESKGITSVKWRKKPDSESNAEKLSIGKWQTLSLATIS